jgi:hypothetical protein
MTLKITCLIVSLRPSLIMSDPVEQLQVIAQHLGGDIGDLSGEPSLMRVIGYCEELVNQPRPVESSSRKSSDVRFRSNDWRIERDGSGLYLVCGSTYILKIDDDGDLVRMRSINGNHTNLRYDDGEYVIREYDQPSLSGDHYLDD